MCLVHPLSKAIRFLDYLDHFLCLDKQGSTTKKLLGTRGCLRNCLLAYSAANHCSIFVLPNLASVALGHY